MKEFFKPVQNDRITFRSFFTAGVLLVFCFLYIIINYRKMPPLIPIFTQLPWGDARISQTATIFLPVAIVCLIVAGNLFFSSKIYQKTPLLARILAITSLFITLLVTIFSVRIVLLIL